MVEDAKKGGRWGAPVCAELAADLRGGRRGLVGAASCEVPRVTWSLVTAPDEQQRCCVVIDGVRCGQQTAWRLASADGALDDYTYVCGDHVELVRRPGDVVTLVAMRGRESGFTLLELLVTVALIAILAAIAMPSFFGETRKTKASAEVQPLFSDLRLRLEQHLQERGAYPPTAGETVWNPASAPSTAKAPIDLAMPEWLPLKLRLSGDREVYCRYTFATGLANVGTNIGTEAAARFGFTAPSANWYYLLAKCDMDGDPSALSWYFTSSTDSSVRRDGEGR